MKKWIFFYVLIIFTVLGIGISIHQNKVTANEVIVSGTVVDAARRSTSKGGTTYAEVISFELNGQTHRFARGFASSRYPKMGRVREVAVNPDNPQQARVRMWPWLEKLMPLTLKQYPVIIFMWLMGCAFFGLGWFLFLYHYEFFRRAIIVPGRVTSYEERRGAKGGTTYVEVISYEVDGQTCTVSGTVGMPFKPKMGTPREVGIDPQNLQHVRVRSGGWFGVVFMVAGLVLWGVIVLADKFH